MEDTEKRRFNARHGISGSESAGAVVSTTWRLSPNVHGVQPYWPLQDHDQRYSTVSPHSTTVDLAEVENHVADGNNDAREKIQDYVSPRRIARQWLTTTLRPKC